MAQLQPWQQKPRITHGMMKCKWYAEQSQNDKAFSVDLMNFAFWFYAHAKASVQKSKDAVLRKKMEKRLNKFYTAGSWPGVSNMEEAHAYLKSHNTWASENNRYYWWQEKQPHLYRAGNHFKSAWCAVAFCHSVQEGLGDLVELGSKTQTAAGRLKESYKKKDWEAVGEDLSKVNTWAGRAESLLWAAPTLETLAGKIGRYSDLLSKLHSGATYAAKLSGMGASNSQAVAGGIALQAVDMAMGCVPILGQVYGETLKWAVNFIPQWKDFMHDYWYKKLHADKFY